MNVIYYEKENGDKPVVNYIESIKTEKFQAKVLWEIDLLEKYGFDLKKPYVDSIKGKKYNKLYELRTNFKVIFQEFFISLKLIVVLYCLMDILKKTIKLI